MAQDYVNGAPNETGTRVCLLVECFFFWFCIDLCRGHCCVLDFFSSSSSLSLSESVSTVYACVEMCM